MLVYGWGIFPFVMYLMSSGVGGLSGGTLGSLAGGLIWLLLMYCVGLNYNGALGYALLVGGFFAQVAQAAVINLVWDGWTGDPVSSVLVWLLFAALGLYIGTRGVGLETAAGRECQALRLSHLLHRGFLFVLLDSNLLEQAVDGASPLIAGLAVLFWLGWMFFSGATRWSSNRVIIGLLLLTYLWMQAWTQVDRWSTIYFIVWLIIGALAFKRGENSAG